MSESTRKAGPNARSVPADVTAAMVELHEALTELASLTGGSALDLVRDASRAASVVTDAVQDMAADLAVSA